MDKKELVEKLISQHRKLQADLSNALIISRTEKNNAGEIIIKNLLKFKQDLDEHINLESGVFYVNYLDKMKEMGKDTANTEKFIAEMKEIGNKVYAFLDKYNSKEAIDTSLENFILELKLMINVLNTRIETEEEGVYDLYLLIM